ncbi:MAG TPA: hypothetical protein VGO57_14215 [Verrucomicrobiae bacterium]|jgi:hypothetical protein
MKRALFLFCGICWLGFGLACAVFSWRFLTAGDGSSNANSVLQVFAPVSPGSISVGLAHVVGFVALTLVCLAIGLLLFLHGLYPDQSRERKSESRQANF